MSLSKIEREIAELRREIFQQEAERGRLHQQKLENQALRELEKTVPPNRARQLLTLLKQDGHLVESPDEDCFLIRAKDRYNLLAEMPIAEGLQSVIREEYPVFDQQSQQAATMDSSTSIANSSPNANTGSTEYSFEELQGMLANPEKRKRILSEVQNTYNEQQENRRRELRRQGLSWGAYTQAEEERQYREMLARQPKLDARQLAERLLLEQRSLP